MSKKKPTQDQPGIQMWCKNYSALLFVWRDVDSISKEISFGDHFDLLWAVVDNVGPGQSQKRLHVSFHECMAEVMIVGRVEGVHSHSDNIIQTGGINQRKIKITALVMWPVQRAAAAVKMFYLFRSSCLMVFKWTRERSSSTNLNSSTWLLCWGWLTTNR